MRGVRVQGVGGGVWGQERWGCGGKEGGGRSSEAAGEERGQRPGKSNEAGRYFHMKEEEGKRKRGKKCGDRKRERVKIG